MLRCSPLTGGSGHIQSSRLFSSQSPLVRRHSAACEWSAWSTARRCRSRLSVAVLQACTRLHRRHWMCWAGHLSVPHPHLCDTFEALCAGRQCWTLILQHCSAPALHHYIKCTHCAHVQGLYGAGFLGGLGLALTQARTQCLAICNMLCQNTLSKVLCPCSLSL